MGKGGAEGKRKGKMKGVDGGKVWQRDSKRIRRGKAKRQMEESLKLYTSTCTVCNIRLFHCN